MWNDPNNCSFYLYLEAGVDYFIVIAYDDPYQVGTIQFRLEYIGETYKQFNIGSPRYFTFEDTEDYEQTSIMGETIAGGIDVVLGEDGYYYEKETYGDPLRQSKLYADFSNPTPIFNQSLVVMIEAGAFNFSLSAGHHYTAEMRTYVEKMITQEDAPDNPELWGCVEVDARLAELLQLFMDKYTFAGVKNSWTKVCYYYQSF